MATSEELISIIKEIKEMPKMVTTVFENNIPTQKQVVDINEVIGLIAKHLMTYNDDIDTIEEQ